VFLHHDLGCSFARPRGCVPYILAFYRGDELVGVAPFYRTRTLHRVVPARSIQFIGQSWRDPLPLISEYLGVIAAREEASEVRRACMQQLLDDDGWTELVVGYTDSPHEWKHGLAGGANGTHQYMREMDHVVSYQADFSSGFDAYLRGLGQSSRRSVWNLRRRLESRGTVRRKQLGLRIFMLRSMSSIASTCSAGRGRPSRVRAARCTSGWQRGSPYVVSSR
jgi:hypothetical protein